MVVLKPYADYYGEYEKQVAELSGEPHPQVEEPDGKPKKGRSSAGG